MLSTRSASRPVSRTSRSALLRDGFRDMLPLALGYVPFAFVIGAAIADSAIDDMAGWAGSFLMAAGSAQLAVVDMVDTGAAPVAIVATAVIINARLAVYSAGLAPWFAHEPARRRSLLAYFLIDPTYLLAVNRFESDDPGPAGRRWYYVGAASILFGTWVTGQTIAVLVGNRIPESVRLDAAAPLIMAGLLARSVSSPPARTAAVVGAGVAVLGAGLPFSSATLLAILVGSAMGARKMGGGR